MNIFSVVLHQLNGNSAENFIPRHELLVDKAQTEDNMIRIQEMGTFLEEICTELTEYDEGMV